ncbi:hypothetical protein RchiOBHm_Chr4g0408601 [Rosa chinensis]|uniref:Uncharacterized protein n=1 Tax=Rosa chinensis TaxID=74649 RepID=A0A2P6QUW1_ROSCH|nr:hypothetical protein RchiOBHm_Chr4g0408601 [Rosa chinensis]
MNNIRVESNLIIILVLIFVSLISSLYLCLYSFLCFLYLVYFRKPKPKSPFNFVIMYILYFIFVNNILCVFINCLIVLH